MSFSQIRGFITLSIISLYCFSANAETTNDRLETLTIDHLRAGFAFMANDQFSKPGKRWHDHPDTPESWLDGVSRLKLSPKLESEIVTLIHHSPGEYHQRYRPVVPPGEERWLEARFHEIRLRPEKALLLYSSAQPGTLSDREKMAYARLLFRQGDFDHFAKITKTITDWSEFNAEVHVFQIVGETKKLLPLFTALRALVQPTQYRKHIYPRELDFYFTKGGWKKALDKAKQDGPLWHLYALKYYGEDKKFAQLFQKINTGENPMSTSELLLYPDSYIGEQLVQRLLGGHSSEAERWQIIRRLANSGGKEHHWLKPWISKHPNEVKKFILPLIFDTESKTLLPTPRKPATIFSNFLQQDQFQHTPETRIARLAIISRFYEAKPLLEFLSTAACKDLPPTGANLPDHPHFIKKMVATDPLALVLAAPRPSMSQQPILTALQKNPSFQSLSSLGQARYLYLAKLRKPLLLALLKTDWNTPAADSFAYASSKLLYAGSWHSQDKLLKARWLNRFLSMKNEEHFHLHLEWWAWQLELLKLPEKDREKTLLEAASLFAEKHSVSQKEILSRMAKGIQSSPEIADSIQKLRHPGELEKNQLASHQILYNRQFGSLLLIAAAVPEVELATGQNFPGIWKPRFYGTSSRPTFFTNRHRIMKSVEYFMTHQFKKIRQTENKSVQEFSSNLASHLKLPADRNLSTFAWHWINQQLVHGEDREAFYHFFKEWPDTKDPGLIMGKLIFSRKKINNSPETKNLVNRYPPAYLRNTPIHRYRLTAQSSPVTRFAKATLSETQFSPPSYLNRTPREAFSDTKKDEETVEQFFKNRLISGATLPELENTLKIYRQSHSLTDLGTLLSRAGNELRKQHPERDWQNEVMTYLETIDPLELHEISYGGNLPMANELFNNPEFSERYFAWLKRAGSNSFKSWVSLPISLLKDGEIHCPSTIVKWFEITLCPSPHPDMVASPLPHQLTPNGSSSHNPYSLLQKHNLLTELADKIVFKLDPSINESITTLLLASSSLDQAKDQFLERLRTEQKEKPISRAMFHLSAIKRSLSQSPEGLRKLTHLQKTFFEDPDLIGVVELEYLFQADTGISADDAIRIVWKNIGLERRNWDGQKFLQIALTEASDDTFYTILKDYGEVEGSFDYISRWEDIIRNHHFADVERLRAILKHLHRKGRLDKLHDRNFQRGFTWDKIAPDLLDIALRCQDEKTLDCFKKDRNLLIADEENLPFRFREEDKQRLSLQSKNPRHPQPIISFYFDDNNKAKILWSLTGRSDNQSGVFKHSIKPFDHQFDLALYSSEKNNGEKLDRIIRKATTHGSITLEGDQLSPGSRYILEASPHGKISEPVASSHSITIPLQKSYRLDLENHWHFRPSSIKGPFGFRKVWRARFIGKDGNPRVVNLHEWPFTKNNQMSLRFWKHSGSNLYAAPRILCLDGDKKILSDIAILTPSGGYISQDNWVEIAYDQENQDIPEGTKTLALAFRCSGGNFYITQPEYSMRD